MKSTTMIDTRRAKVSATYNNKPFSGEAGTDIESLTYTDSASDNCDSVDITINAQDSKWLKGWMPEKGATIKPRIIGEHWSKNGKGKHTIKCGLFVLDDISYADRPSTLQISGVSKPSDDNFSEMERDQIWKNTSIKRIGQTIADRYKLSFSYDADDYDIECDEQSDATDSSYYNSLCKKYGLILKVYAKTLWVFDREMYKKKKAVKTFSEDNIIRGSLKYNTTLSGTYTGGTFSYTDSDKDIDINCSIGGGTHTKNINQRATSVYDASVQLCAEINNANHGKTQIKFTTDGDFTVSAGQVIALTGYGSAKNGGLNGNYYVDKITHKLDAGGGFTSDFECSLIEKSFNHWDVGGSIETHEKESSSGSSSTPTYNISSVAENASAFSEGSAAGEEVFLINAQVFKYNADFDNGMAARYTGLYYLYDGILTNGKYRICATKSDCSKYPANRYAMGWILSRDAIRKSRYQNEQDWYNLIQRYT